MQQTRCINCMKQIASNVKACPHCGFDQQTVQMSNALRPNTILRDRYLIGRVIGRGGFGITYVGFDLTLEMKVAIKEYYPTGMASRNSSWSDEVMWETAGDDSSVNTEEQTHPPLDAQASADRSEESEEYSRQGSDLGSEGRSRQSSGMGSEGRSRQSSGMGSEGRFWQSSGMGSESRSRQDIGMERVLKEARRTARLSGIPAVVGVHDVFQANKTAYIVMEFIEGLTLKDYLAKYGTLTWRDCARLLVPVMDGLAQAHALGIVHRDISPDNIMICEDGTSRLLDLGAAVDIQANDGHASTLVVKNHFSAMEQYDENGVLGSYTDIYAFAAVIYYCLTREEIPPVMERVLMKKEILFPPEAGIPEDVRKALEKAMEIQPEDRFQSMREFKDALLKSESGQAGRNEGVKQGEADREAYNADEANGRNDKRYDSASETESGTDTGKTAMSASVAERKAGGAVDGKTETGKENGQKSRKNRKKTGLFAAAIVLCVLVLAGTAAIVINRNQSTEGQPTATGMADGTETQTEESDTAGAVETAGNSETDETEALSEIQQEARAAAALAFEAESLAKEAEEKAKEAKEAAAKAETVAKESATLAEEAATKAQDAADTAEIVTYPSGDTYQGETNGEEPEGYGIFTYSNGSYYAGEWSGGERNGYGIFYLNDGSSYACQWVDGAQDGSGVLSQFNGTSYAGEFEEGLISGYGTCYWADGSSCAGEWYGGGLSGYAVYYEKGSGTYACEWSEGSTEGYGVFSSEDGTVYAGEWHNAQSGYGVFYELLDGGTYAGEWADDKRNGYGVLYSSSGEILSEGLWADDVLQEDMK